ncbi:hypothetical protein J6590_054441 [Homalodisca vitripennis]|nr:hypothetical protein J6590_054441 [Homalodisca vitripennis]
MTNDVFAGLNIEIGINAHRQCHDLHPGSSACFFGSSQQVAAPIECSRPRLPVVSVSGRGKSRAIILIFPYHDTLDEITLPQEEPWPNLKW